MTDIAPDAAERSGLAHAWLRRYPSNVDWFGEVDDGPVFGLLDQAARRHPNRPCTNFFGRLTTYEEIARLVDQAAAGLQALGVAKGTKIGLFLPNSPTFIIY